MKRQLKEAWITALRSGQYVQGNGQFRRVWKQDPKVTTETFEGVTRTVTTEISEVKHCCLGVLAEVCGTFPEYGPFSFGDENGIYDSKGSFAPAQLEGLGIEKKVQDVLVTMNDDPSEGSFKLIANAIECLVSEDIDSDLDPLPLD